MHIVNPAALLIAIACFVVAVQAADKFQGVNEHNRNNGNDRQEKRNNNNNNRQTVSSSNAAETPSRLSQFLELHKTESNIQGGSSNGIDVKSRKKYRKSSSSTMPPLRDSASISNDDLDGLLKSMEQDTYYGMTNKPLTTVDVKDGKNTVTAHFPNTHKPKKSNRRRAGKFSPVIVNEDENKDNSSN